jgi:hypothetical protein
MLLYNIYYQNLGASSLNALTLGLLLRSHNGEESLVEPVMRLEVSKDTDSMYPASPASLRSGASRQRIIEARETWLEPVSISVDGLLGARMGADAVTGIRE